MRRAILIGGLSMAVWLALAPGLARAQKVVHAHIPGSFMSLPVYVAYEKGLYRKHGLDVDLASIVSGPDTVAAVIAGSVDFQLNSGDNLMRAMDQGAPSLKIVVGNLGQMPFTLIAHKDLPLPSKGKGYPDVMRDFKGRTLGVVARGGSVDYIMRAMVRDGGLDPDRDVTWVAVGTAPTAIPAMQNKQIDAYLAFEPFQTRALTELKMGQAVVDLRRGEGPRQFKDFPYNFYSGRADRIEGRPELVTRYVAAMVESHRYIQTAANFEGVVAAAAKYILMADPLLRQMLKDNIPTLSALVTEPGLGRWIEFARTAQGIKRQFTYGDLTAPRFLPKP